MRTLLEIRTSLNGTAGLSTQLAERLVSEWKRLHPQGHIVTRDLAADPVPHLTAARFAAFAANPDERTPEQQAIVSYSDALISELREADTIVLTAPMYNFSVPSTLRAYFDHIARAGVTFRYTAAGSEGALTGKRAYVLITRGGSYAPAADTQTPYLRQFLAFVGITDVEFIHVEGLAISADSREQSLSAARAAIDRLVPSASEAAAA